METLEQKTLKWFCQEEAEDAYRRYLDDPDSITPGEVVDQFLPLCQVLLKIQFWYVPQYLYEDLLSDSYLGLYSAVVKKKCDADRIDYSFFYAVVKNSMYTSYKKNLPTRMRTHKYALTTDLPFASKYTSDRDIINHLFVKQLPDIIRKSVLRRVRFVGDEYRACRYILNRFLMRKQVISNVLKTRYNIPEEQHKFLVDFVAARSRVELYKLRKGIDLDLDNNTNMLISLRDYDRELNYDRNQNSQY